MATTDVSETRYGFRDGQSVVANSYDENFGRAKPATACDIASATIERCDTRPSAKMCAAADGAISNTNGVQMCASENSAIFKQNAVFNLRLPGNNLDAEQVRVVDAETACDCGVLNKGIKDNCIADAGINSRRSIQFAVPDARFLMNRAVPAYEALGASLRCYVYFSATVFVSKKSFIH